MVDRRGGLFCFVWFDSLRPINNLSVIKGRVFLGWTSTKIGLMFLLKDTTQWRRWGSNPRSFGLESSALPLSHCSPLKGGAYQWEETSIDVSHLFDWQQCEAQSANQEKSECTSYLTHMRAQIFLYRCRDTFHLQRTLRTTFQNKGQLQNNNKQWINNNI